MSTDKNKNETPDPGREGENRFWDAARMQQAIHAYMNQEMSDQEKDEFWAQLVEQPEYYKYLELEASLRKLYRDKQEGSDDTPEGSAGTSGSDSDEAASAAEPETVLFSLSKYGGWIAAVAAVATLVIAINLMRISGPVSDEPEPGIVSAEEFAPLLSSIDELYFESIDAFRDESSDEDFVQLFDEGLLAAFSGDNETALSIYKQLIEEFPEDKRIGMAQLNTGIIQYNNEDFEAAEESFGSALRLAELYNAFSLQEKAYWLKANAQLQNGRIQAAHETLKKTIEYRGSFESEARELKHVINPYIDE